MFNECKCPNPPGGNVVCEENQMAVCMVKDGEATHLCLSPLSRLNGPNKLRTLVNWAFIQVTAQPRNFDAEVTQKEIDVLLSGRYLVDGKTIFFKLPKEIHSALFYVLAAQAKSKGTLSRPPDGIAR